MLSYHKCVNDNVSNFVRGKSDFSEITEIQLKWNLHLQATSWDIFCDYDEIQRIFTIQLERESHEWDNFDAHRSIIIVLNSKRYWNTRHTYLPGMTEAKNDFWRWVAPPYDRKRQQQFQDYFSAHPNIFSALKHWTRSIRMFLWRRSLCQSQFSLELSFFLNSTLSNVFHMSFFRVLSHCWHLDAHRPTSWRSKNHQFSESYRNW